MICICVPRSEHCKGCQKSYGDECPHAPHIPSEGLSIALVFADRYGLPIIPCSGGWRVDILDPRLEPGMPMFDAQLHERWKEAGHGGSWVFFYGKTIQETVAKAGDWLQRHKWLMEIKEIIRQRDREKPMPNDKCID